MNKIFWGILLSVTFILGACSTNKTTEQQQTKKEINVSTGAELSTVDVSQAMDNIACDAMTQVGEGLFNFDDKGRAVPALAESIVEPTDDGLVYEFKLRKGAKWSNGDPVTAKDFEYSWKRTVDPKTAFPQAYYFSGIKNYQEIESGKSDSNQLGVTALDDHTLKVELNYPMPYFQQLLAVPAFYPMNQTFVESKGKDYGTNSENTLYNGPFVLEGWDGTNEEWAYVKNKNYWDQKNVAIDRVNVHVVKEVATGKNLFDDGQLDKVQLSGEFVAQEKNNEALYLRKIPGTYYAQLNTTKEFLKDKEVRQMLSLVIDSESLATKVMKDGSEKSLGFVPTGFIDTVSNKDFAKELGDLNPYNTKKAKELWTKVKKATGKNLVELELVCSDTDNSKKMGEYIQGAIESNLDGIKVNVTPVPFANRLERSRKGEFDLVIGGWTPVYADPIDFLTLLQSNNSNNFGQWKNEAFDQAIMDANVTYGNRPEERWETLKQAELMVAEEMPLIPLYQITEAYLINPDVKGLKMGPIGSPYYKNVTME